MCNIIGGQLDERLNAFLATCHVVIYMLYVITCDSCGKYNDDNDGDDREHTSTVIIVGDE